LLRLFPLIK